MNRYTLIGLILIVLGIATLAYQGITYTTREKVVDIGPVHVTAQKTRTIPLSPIAGAVALVGGIYATMCPGRSWSVWTRSLRGRRRASGLGDLYESRHVPIVVQQRVEFDAAFGGPKLGPVKQR